MKYHTPAVLNTKKKSSKLPCGVSFYWKWAFTFKLLLYLERSNPKENDTSTNREHTIFHVAIFFMFKVSLLLSQ